jgi:hypothetical protein
LDSLLLQDWVTIAATSGVSQSTNSALDISNYEDLVVYSETKQLTQSDTLLVLSTAPSRDDASFAPMVRPIVLVAGTQVTSILAVYANIPPARFLRWALATVNTEETFSVTFRIWVAAYSLSVT